MRLAITRLTLFVGGLAPMCASDALAMTIFDTGQPDETAGYSVYYATSTNYQSLAARFTITAPTRLSGVQAWMNGAFGMKDDLVLSLLADVNGVPGVAITSQLLHVPAVSVGPPYSFWFGGFSDGATILAPGDYWAKFSVDPLDPAGYAGSFDAYAPMTIPFAAFQNGFTGSGYLVRDAHWGFRVFGDPVVPVFEPSCAFVGLALCIAASRLRRGRLAR